MMIKNMLAAAVVAGVAAIVAGCCSCKPAKACCGNCTPGATCVCGCGQNPCACSVNRACAK